LSSDSIEVLALAAGAGSRSSSASSAGHRVSRKTLKDRQGKPLAIKDSQGRTLVPMNAVQRRSKDLENGSFSSGFSRSLGCSPIIHHPSVAYA
jgi:hypothetical protein